MQSVVNKLLSVFVVAITMVMYGCGGGSGSSDGGGVLAYSGNESPATIDASSAKEIGEAAGESVGQAASSSALPSGIEIVASEVDAEMLYDLVSSTVDLAFLPQATTVDGSDFCTAGGSASVTYSGSGATSGNGPLNLRITYSNCAYSYYGGIYSINGTVRAEYEDIGNPSAGISFQYVNVTVSSSGLGTHTINYSFTCTNASDYDTCTTYSLFEGADGGTHQISEYSFSGNSTSGYSGSATFSHESYGTVTITVSGITYGSCGSQPDGGSISYSSTNGTSGSITFLSDCTSSGSWNNGVTSGVF